MNNPQALRDYAQYLRRKANYADSSQARRADIDHAISLERQADEVEGKARGHVTERPDSWIDFAVACPCQRTRAKKDARRAARVKSAIAQMDALLEKKPA